MNCHGKHAKSMPRPTWDLASLSWVVLPGKLVSWEKKKFYATPRGPSTNVSSFTGSVVLAVLSQCFFGVSRNPLGFGLLGHSHSDMYDAKSTSLLPPGSLIMKLVAILVKIGKRNAGWLLSVLIYFTRKNSFSQYVEFFSREIRQFGVNMFTIFLFQKFPWTRRIQIWQEKKYQNKKVYPNKIFFLKTISKIYTMQF